MDSLFFEEEVFDDWVKDLNADGVRVTRLCNPLGRNTGYWYHIPCERCGRDVKRTQYSKKREYVCEYCRQKELKRKRVLKKSTLENVKTRADRRFDKAVEEIKSQVKDFDKYKKAIELARMRCEKYASVPEAMVAIELLKIGYKIIPQQQIKKYRVDFLLPNEKYVIEVDGKVYHRDIYGGDREAVIQFSLGLDWKILHIPAEDISKQIYKLQEVINRLAKI